MKSKTSASTPPTSDSSVDSPHDASRNIWLAGLGALTRAQAEGGKAFENLVREGLAAQQAAQDRMREVSRRVEAFNQEVVSATSPRWPGLESIFETRVERALTALGIPGQEAWANLVGRVAALEAALQLSGTSAPPSAKKKALTRKTSPRPLRSGKTGPS